MVPSSGFKFRDFILTRFYYLDNQVTHEVFMVLSILSLNICILVLLLLENIHIMLLILFKARPSDLRWFLGIYRVNVVLVIHQILSIHRLTKLSYSYELKTHHLKECVNVAISSDFVFSPFLYLQSSH